jgi:rhodanese-related sulfurtransferase
MKKIMTTILFLSVSLPLHANGILAEVQKNGLTIIDENGKHVKIDRETHPECGNKNISPEALFGGDFAGNKVAEPCKKSFVTKVGLMQPMQLGQNIQTVGELEVLAHIKNAQTQPEEYILVDARTRPWFEQMTIPTSVNIPFNEIHYEEDLEKEDFKSKTAYETYREQYERLFEHLNIKMKEDELDFSKAKSVIIYCNGSWCSQSPKAIFKLINLGYPKEKLLWYRGGLQDWLIYDFTVSRSK